MRGAARYLSVLLGLFCLSGCGTYVPDIQEFWGAPDEAGNRVNAIAYQVGCELGKAVHGAFQTDERTGKPRRIAELQNWTAELVLFLIVDEKSNFSPSVTYIDPLKSMQSFSLGLAGNLSAEATRTDKLHLFYPLKQFVNYDNDKPCIPERQSGGILFTQSDLKLYEWMSREVVPQFTGTAANYKDIAPKSLAAAFSTDIKFEIVSSGGVTPTWKLTRVSTAASSGSLFGASRDRTQELIITLGPTEPLGKGGNTFGTVAQQSSFSSEFSSEVAAKNIANRLDR